MHTISRTTGDEAYVELLRMVLRFGRQTSPRGQLTFDVGPTTVMIFDPKLAFPMSVGRRLNPAILAAEALQLIGGFSAPELLPKAFDPYKEDDGTFWGAYGVRIGDQVEAQLDKFHRDPSTRQAVITLWDPNLDNQPGKRDYPCTTSLHLSKVDGVLDWTTVMRSQDVFLGAPYDWGQFVTLQETCARSLNVGLGVYRHITLSTHLYDRDRETALQITAGEADYERTIDENFGPLGIGLPGMSFADIRRRAALLRAGETPERPTMSELRYLKLLAKYHDAGEAS